MLRPGGRGTSRGVSPPTSLFESKAGTGLKGDLLRVAVGWTDIVALVEFDLVAQRQQLLNQFG